MLNLIQYSEHVQDDGYKEIAAGSHSYRFVLLQKSGFPIKTFGNDRKEKSEIAALLEFVSMDCHGEFIFRYIRQGVRFLHTFRTVGSQ